MPSSNKHDCIHLSVAYSVAGLAGLLGSSQVDVKVVLWVAWVRSSNARSKEVNNEDTYRRLDKENY